MDKISWNEAPHWADRVIKGGDGQLLWASDDSIQPVNDKHNILRVITVWHVTFGCPVVERRPTVSTGIDWSKAPEWADRVVRSPSSGKLYWANYTSRQMVFDDRMVTDNLHVRYNWEVVHRRPAHFPTQPPETFMCRCVAAPVSLTIEQRIASLRALEKQVEETRAELTRDLEVLGLTWMVRDDPIDIETPTDITDWRDLRVDDIVGFDGLDGEYTVCDLESTGYNGCEPIKVVEDIPVPCRYIRWPDVSDHPWRFIRRP